jgi:hypothetical protein
MTSIGATQHRDLTAAESSADASAAAGQKKEKEEEW